MIILDTNVISELMKADPAKMVFSWVDARSIDEFFTTAVNQAEILFGIAVMSAGQRKDLLRRGAARMFEQQFRGRILPFDNEAAVSYADIVARRRRAGMPIDKFDAEIAAIAASRSMTVATRDVADFKDCGVPIVNPWND